MKVVQGTIEYIELCSFETNREFTNSYINFLGDQFYNDLP